MARKDEQAEAEGTTPADVEAEQQAVLAQAETAQAEERNDEGSAEAARAERELAEKQERERERIGRERREAEAGLRAQDEPADARALRDQLEREAMKAGGSTATATEDGASE